MRKKKMYGRFSGIMMTFIMLFSLVSAPITYAEGGTSNKETDQDTFHLSVMHMNDTHAHVEPMPHMITAIKEFREDNPEALLLHGGDVLSGTLYFNEFKGQADVAMMNLMEMDAMVFGNHEFDLGAKENGQESLAKFVEAANFPLLGTNIDFSGDPFMRDLVYEGKAVENAAGGQAYHSIIKEVNGEKVGIFGLTTEDTVHIANPMEVTFSDYIQAAEDAVAEFESLGINKVIAVNHIGYNSNPAVGNDLLLAAHVEGIDIIVGGHSHTPLEQPVLVTTDADGNDKDPTVIVQAGEYSQYLGTLNVEFNESGVIVGYDGELLEVANYEADEEAVEVLKPFKEKVDELATEETGAVALKDLLNPRQSDGNGYKSVRATETELGNLVTDAMLAKAKEKFPETVISMQNGGGIRAPIEAGPITIGEVISVLPFGNDPVIAQLTGAEIKEVLEHSVSNAPGENGGFLHVSGMKFTFDSAKEVGSRVQSIEVDIDGIYVPIDENAEYTITTNNFTGTGGDGFETFAKAFDEGRVKDIGEIDWEQLVDYMTEEEYLNGVVDPEIEGRIINLSAPDQDFRLSLMHMNDTHAHVEPMPSMITAIKEIRSKKPEALLLHAGDVFTGTMYFNEFKGQADLAMMNLMDIDAMVFGNHEFDLGASEEGHQALHDFVIGANFPLLGSNIDFSQDAILRDIASAERLVENPDPGKSYHSIVKEVNGEKIGIFGLTTEDTINIASPNDVTFKNYIETAEEAVAEFEAAGINKIIAVNHIGFDSDPSVGNDLLLAQYVDGIDIIVGGHSHTKLEEPVFVTTDENGVEKDPTVIVQAFQYSEFLGTLDVDFDEDGVVTSFDGELLEVANYDEDEEAAAVLAEYSEQVEEVMNKPSGAVAMKDLLNPRQEKPGDDSVRANETELGNLVTDAMLAKAKLKVPETVIAFQNGGGIRQEIKKGPITIGEIISVLPFGNNPVVVELTGAEIKEILEHSVRNAPGENGGFLHVAGMKFVFDSTKEVGSRVQSMEVNIDGTFTPIVANETYMITTNAFTGAGGDGFDVFAQAYEEGRVRDIGESDWEQLMSYMVDDLGGQVDPVREGRIIDLLGAEIEDPKEPEEPEKPGEPTDPEDPGTPGDDGTKPGLPGDDGTKPGDGGGKEIPKTATPMYNYMLIGLILLASGGGMIVYRRVRVRQKV